MTNEERLRAFVAAFHELEQRYGVTVVARTVPADTPVPVTPPIQPAFIQDWKDPEPKKESES